MKIGVEKSFSWTLVRASAWITVGKIGIDQLDQAISKGKRCAKQAEQAKALTGQHDVCRETHQVCLYYT
jgi:hypothetical protein